jgi:hypothetical protein
MKKVIIYLLLNFPVFSYAGAYTGEAAISWMSSIVENAQGKHFVLSGNWANQLNCSKMQEGIWLIYAKNNSLEELHSMYSMAMAAYMSGKTIELYANDCGSSGRPHAESLYLPSRNG